MAPDLAGLRRPPRSHTDAPEHRVVAPDDIVIQIARETPIQPRGCKPRAGWGRWGVNYGIGKVRGRGGYWILGIEEIVAEGRAGRKGPFTGSRAGVL